MTKKSEEGKRALIEWAKSRYFGFDRWGNMKNKSGNTRIKFQTNSARIEKKLEGLNIWTRLYSGYYKNISITEDGKLKGMKR